MRVFSLAIFRCWLLCLARLIHSSAGPASSQANMPGGTPLAGGRDRRMACLCSSRVRICMLCHRPGSS